jgi:hypothetical protein
MAYVRGMCLCSRPDRSLFIGTLLAFMLAGASAVAQQPARPFEGTWIWDRSLYIRPHNIKSEFGMVAETMSVSIDDGVHYKARFAQVFSNGAQVTLVEDFAEDGSDHSVDYPPDGATVRISSLPDGGRRIVFTRMGHLHDTTCHVSPDGNPLTCIGILAEPDGSIGQDRCVYHREIPFAPIS